tara:strand:- start:1721 stop:2323 length:603 start_codon:yes stop_codon:yes gene_type:complete
LGTLLQLINNIFYIKIVVLDKIIEMKLNEIDKKNKIIVFLISVLILSQFRLIDHPWNFTPVIAFGILAGYYLKNVFYGYALIILSMILGDLIIGFHNLIFFTYLGLLFSVVIGKYIQQLKIKQIFLSSIASAVIFFVISNFGVWLLGGFYELTLQDLVKCYVVAIPFFRSTLISTIIFTIVFKTALDQLKLDPAVIKRKI